MITAPATHRVAIAAALSQRGRRGHQRHLTQAAHEHNGGNPMTDPWEVARSANRATGQSGRRADRVSSRRAGAALKEVFYQTICGIAVFFPTLSMTLPVPPSAPFR